MSTTPSPTLPATWTPTKQGCLKTDDYWIFRWDLGGQDARTVQGGPSQTTDCFPSTWNPTGTYVGSGCPVQYTSACQGNDSASAVTCCPTAFNYACQTEAGTPGRHAEWFPCVSRHTTGGNITVTVTDFASNTIAVEKRGRNTNQHLFALGMVYTTPTSSISAPTIEPTSIAPTSILPTSIAPAPSQGGGLSSGAAAGIGVGAGCAVIILASLAWLCWRRRQKDARGAHDGAAGNPDMLSGGSAAWPQSPREFYASEQNGSPARFPGDFSASEQNSWSAAHSPQGFGASEQKVFVPPPSLHELPGRKPPVELPGQSGWGLHELPSR